MSKAILASNKELTLKADQMPNIHNPQRVLEKLSRLFNHADRQDDFADILDNNGIALTSDVAQSERDNISDDLGTDTENCITGDNADLQEADKRARKGYRFSHNDSVGVEVPIDDEDVADVINDIKDTYIK